MKQVLIVLAVGMLVGCSKSPPPIATQSSTPTPTTTPATDPTPANSTLWERKLDEVIRSTQAKPKVVGKRTVARTSVLASTAAASATYDCQSAQTHNCYRPGICHCTNPLDPNCSYDSEKTIVEADMDMNAQSSCELTGTINGQQITLFGDVRAYQHANTAQRIHVRYCSVCKQIMYAEFQ